MQATIMVEWRRDSGSTVWNQLDPSAIPPSQLIDTVLQPQATIKAWNDALGWEKYRMTEVES